MKGLKPDIAMHPIAKHELFQSSRDEHAKDSQAQMRQGRDNPGADLGHYLRQLRADLGWTLADASAAAGIARSSISKIENGQMSPTYDLLLKLAAGYNVDLADFFARSGTQDATGRMTVTRRGKGQPHPANVYRHEVLAAGLSHKKMQPFHTHIRALAPDEALDWAVHAGEEFIYVLSGVVIFHTEHYEPVILQPGDSIYIDSAMRHTAVAEGRDGADVLWMAAS